MPDDTVPEAARVDAALLDGLNASQRRAVTGEGEPMCILAGAGSGKTRVLTRRVAYRVARGSADPRHVLALTFTRKAASELRSRLGALGVREQVVAGTFHAVAYAQLRRRWHDRGERPPGLLERKAQILAPMLRGRDGGPGQLGDVAAEIEWAKARMVDPARYEREVADAGRRPPLPAATMASLYDSYEQLKRRRGLVDFDDLLLLCATALEDDAEFASVQRWRFRHFFVDEFQDVNRLQFRLLEGWRGGRPDLCVVGDPNQAIYGWNGADSGFLVSFRRHLPEATVVHLDTNYRSSPQVLAVANAVLESQGQGARRLVATQDDGPLPTVTSYATDVDEARAVARWARRGHPSVPWRHVAVLARTNAQLLLFEQAFRAADVPYRVRGGPSFLQRPAVREALAELRRRSPGAALSVLAPDLDEMARAAGDDDGPAPGPDAGAGPPGAGRPTTGREGSAREDLENLARLAREQLALDPAATLEGFLAWLVATLGRDDHQSDGDGVELATFHAAKGLEWPVVFLTGLERGLVPIAHAETPEARAEERRLLYVAVTRARRQLHCSWSERRTFGARTSSRAPSPYLDVVEAAVRALREAGPTAHWRRFISESRGKLPPGRAKGSGGYGPAIGERADPAVLAALRAWRAETARASGVPAFVVFHDTTLAALAEARPRDRSGLLTLPGVGPVKAERYGDAVLALVAPGSEHGGRAEAGSHL